MSTCSLRSWAGKRACRERRADAVGLRQATIEGRSAAAAARYRDQQLRYPGNVGLSEVKGSTFQEFCDEGRVMDNSVGQCAVPLNHEVSVAHPRPLGRAR